MKMWARVNLELAEVCVRGFLVLLICVLDAGSQGQMVCDTEVSTQWLLVPQTLEVRWTLARKTCSSSEECWGIRGHGHEEELSSMLWTFPQMCPVQLQVGDKLLVSADDTLESYGIHLLNVSKESFRSCSTTEYPADQLLFPGYIKGTVEVDPKWLRPGTYHFVAAREGNPALCKAGLRLVVRVRGHRCRRNTSRQLCVGNGACRAAGKDNMFSCTCRRGFSGRFCERFNGWPSRRHVAGSLCARRGPAYECVCPSQPAGMHCSKVIHLCNERCLNGRCESVAPNSIRCMCDPGFTGLYCEREVSSCDSSPCKNSGTCVETPAGHVCVCAEGFPGPNCDGEFAAERVMHDRPHKRACNTSNNSFPCAKEPNPCSSNPCLNNGSCTPSGEQYHCRCRQEFTGRDCEEVTDYCGMLGIGCLNEGLCLSIIGGYRCLCAPGWTGEFCQHMESACRIYPNRCQNGAACVDGSQQGAPRNYTCLCLHGYTGFHCETNVNECGSNPCLHGGMCRDLIGSYKCMCPPGFLGENCEVNADTCIPPNATCLPGSGCTAHLDGRPSTCLTSCPQHIQPCANGGCCFLTGDDGTRSCFCSAGWTGPACQQNIDECVAHRCQHGATCVDGIGTFWCLCRHGYTGAFCERCVSNCIGHRCVGRGACVNRGSGYAYRCILGFDGSLCELEVDECGSRPCANRTACTGSLTVATCHCPLGSKGRTCSEKAGGCWSCPCVHLIGGYTCQCPRGENCEIEVDECLSLPCHNGALCVDALNGFCCLCLDGTAGMACKVDVGECASSPCQNGAACVDQPVNYTCQCVAPFKDVDGFHCVSEPGFAALQCECTMGDCGGHTCENSSMCVDLHSSHWCLCQPGWAGPLCHRETDECESQPCMNGATCVSLPTSYSCSCSLGWTGPDCSVHLPECDLVQCQNGGACMESTTRDGFSCVCPPQYAGTLCQLPHNPCDLQQPPCRYNSTCMVSNGGEAACWCRPGFVGSHCEIDTEECISQSCPNEGTCVDRVGAYRSWCAYPPSFFGPVCGRDVNECDTSPCLHGGSVSTRWQLPLKLAPRIMGLRCEMMHGCLSQPCRNSTGGEAGPHGYRPEGLPGATCRTDAAGYIHGSCIDAGSECRCCCEPGWTGDRCDTDINECKSNPCLNGASCMDLIAEYACICRDGYTGMSCEVDVDVCRESLIFPLCHNGGLCLDGPGSRFTCSCPAGFTGTSCEVEVNECDSDPCFNGAVCQDLVSGYYCHCHPGWTGLRCDADINECLLEPCEQGLCIQSLPGQGYTCFCRPGFVGRHCEYSYNDCLLHTCPPDHRCLNGINNVTCIPIVAGDQTVTLALPALWNSVQMSQPSVGSETETLREAPRTSGFTYAFYSGDSFLEFKVTDVTNISISLRFESPAVEGTLLYADGGSASHHSFFMQLFIDRGVVQYALACGAAERPWRMNTTMRICARTEYTLHLRQQLAPCEVEMTVSGHRAAWSQPSSSRSGPPVRRAAHLFVGGVPFGHTLAPGAEPIINYTGCIEITELIQPSAFLPLRAVGRGSVEGCRNTPLPVSPTPMMVACDGTPCLNGATCRALRLRPGGAACFACDCPLYFSGRLCERDTPVFFPSFHGDSYLELPPLSSLLQQDGATGEPPSAQGGVNAVTLYLTLQSASPQGTVLFSQERGAGERFLHVFLVDGRAMLRLRCSRTLLLTRVAAGRISGAHLTPVMVRYNLPARGGVPRCTAEIEMASGTGRWRESPPSHPVLQVELGPIFLGGVPTQSWLRDHEGGTGFVGCIGVLQVNDREVHLVKEAVKGRNIRNCLSSPCQQRPCRNGGTCVSDVAGWSCRCPPLFAGRLCQLSACMHNPCLHGGTCVPCSPSDTVCLCPYGRAGLLCQDAVNISRPSFGGTDRFGYSSFVAYTSLPDSILFYEFSLKLTFAGTASSFRDGLILFAGQKGLGLNGDDFLAVGVWRGRIIHRFNLGSGVGTVVSAPLSQKPGIHMVHFGRSLRTGWLKVDNQRNRTGSSPGPLVGLNTFGWLYVGGFNEHTPELLPPGSRFRSGFQGCIFDLLLRTRRGARLQPLEGQPILGRSVGQCGVNPCALVRCQNGGTCLNSTSSVYCQCPSGWKGALCSETMSACDAEHVPPPSCAHGSTCIPLLDGYTCQCPLGTMGRRCQQALAISDPFFNGTQSSWMSFPLLGVKLRTDVELQFQTLSPEGLMFYTAQHLIQGADFFSLSLTSGFMQLRYNLGDRTVQLQSANRVDAGGGSWHTVRAGRQGNRGYLVLDGMEERLDPPPGMANLDVSSEMFVGGVPTSVSLPADAVEGEPIGFTGCIRELVVNGRQLDLSETGALHGANVGDCDGTACGFHVCRNGGHCTAVSSEAAVCTCPPLWTGPTCSLSVFCLNNLCQHSSTCEPDLTSASYHCSCPLGWEGIHCERETSLRSAGFLGNSFLKYRDPEYPSRTLIYTKIAFNFTSSSSDGLVLWMGKAEDEVEDYLAIGLQDGHLKMAINLGESLSIPLVHRGARLCCQKWHHLAVVQNRTAVQAFVDGELVVFQDVDPLEQYVALDYGGIFYFGGFELYRNTSEVTHGLFSQGFVGKLKGVFLYDDLRALQFLHNSEGINVYEGD